VHAALRLSGGKALLFQDVRRFGGLTLVVDRNLDDCEQIKALGLEPLSPAFTPQKLHALLQGSKRPVKNLLMDQSCIAGLGNIYTTEALFRAGIHPARRTDRVSRGESRRLCRAIRQVLRESIAAGGTTISDYRLADGSLGQFALRLRVYGREGEPCRRCRAPIARLVLSGRSTFFCPKCQRD